MTARTVLTPDLPFALQLELTSRCNLRCKMCPLTTGTSSTSARPGHVTESTWERVLPFARRCRQVFIAGYGEPFTNPRCLDLMRDLDAHGVEVSIATNGLVVTPQIASELAKLHHLAEVNVSIDSPDPRIYRHLRGGNFDRAWRGLASVAAALRPAQVSVSSVLMASNAASLLAMPAALATLGVRHLCVNGVIDYNDFAAGSSLLARVDLATVVAELRAECERHGVYLVVGAEERLTLELEDPARARATFHDHPDADADVTRQCMVPWEVPFVDKDGTVFACCYAASANARPLGNVHERALDDIWTDEPFQTFRSDLLDGRTAPEICRRCTVAPLGQHLLRAWAAEVVPGSLRVTNRRVRVRVRNTGAKRWRREDLVRLGTRDGASPIAHPTWLFPTRPATFLEDDVPPGAEATFEFKVAPTDRAVVQRFHLVVEGRLWLPALAIDVPVRRRRRRRGWSVRPTPADPPVSGLAAELVRVEVEAGTVRVEARNVGTQGWTRGDHVRVGTARPRDHDSALAHPTWIQPNRPATFAETTVAPGAIATFEFELGTSPAPAIEHFQLVADGFCWLRGTEFRGARTPDEEVL